MAEGTFVRQPGQVGSVRHLTRDSQPSSSQTSYSGSASRPAQARFIPQQSFQEVRETRQQGTLIRQPGQVGSARHRARDVQTAYVEQPVYTQKSTARDTLLEISPGKPVPSKEDDLRKLKQMRATLISIPPEFRSKEAKDMIGKIDKNITRIEGKKEVVMGSTARKTLLEISPGKAYVEPTPAKTISPELEKMRATIMTVPSELRTPEMTRMLREIDKYKSESALLAAQPSITRDEAEIKKLDKEKERLEMVSKMVFPKTPIKTTDSTGKKIPEGYEIRTLPAQKDIFLDIKQQEEAKPSFYEQITSKYETEQFFRPKEAKTAGYDIERYKEQSQDVLLGKIEGIDAEVTSERIKAYEEKGEAYQKGITPLIKKIELKSKELETAEKTMLEARKAFEANKSQETFDKAVMTTDVYNTKVEEYTQLKTIWDTVYQPQYEDLKQEGKVLTSKLAERDVLVEAYNKHEQQYAKAKERLEKIDPITTRYEGLSQYKEYLIPRGQERPETKPWKEMTSKEKIINSLSLGPTGEYLMSKRVVGEGLATIGQGGLIALDAARGLAQVSIVEPAKEFVKTKESEGIHQALGKGYMYYFRKGFTQEAEYSPLAQAEFGVEKRPMLQRVNWQGVVDTAKGVALIGSTASAMILPAKAAIFTTGASSAYLGSQIGLEGTRAIGKLSQSEEYKQFYFRPEYAEAKAAGEMEVQRELAGTNRFSRFVQNIPVIELIGEKKRAAYERGVRKYYSKTYEGEYLDTAVRAHIGQGTLLSQKMRAWESFAQPIGWLGVEAGAEATGQGLLRAYKKAGHYPSKSVAFREIGKAGFVEASGVVMVDTRAQYKPIDVKAVESMVGWGAVGYVMAGGVGSTLVGFEQQASLKEGAKSFFTRKPITQAQAVTRAKRFRIGTYIADPMEKPGDILAPHLYPHLYKDPSHYIKTIKGGSFVWGGVITDTPEGMVLEDVSVKDIRTPKADVPIYTKTQYTPMYNPPVQTPTSVMMPAQTPTSVMTPAQTPTSVPAIIDTPVFSISETLQTPIQSYFTSSTALSTTITTPTEVPSYTTMPAVIPSAITVPTSVSTMVSTMTGVPTTVSTTTNTSTSTAVPATVPIAVPSNILMFPSGLSGGLPGQDWPFKKSKRKRSWIVTNPIRNLGKEFLEQQKMKELVGKKMGVNLITGVSTNGGGFQSKIRQMVGA